MEELLPILNGGSIGMLNGVRGIAFLGTTVRSTGRRRARKLRISIVNPGHPRGGLDRALSGNLETSPPARIDFDDHCSGMSLRLPLVQSCGLRQDASSKATIWLSTNSNGSFIAITPDMLWIADDVFTIHHGWLGGVRGRNGPAGIRIPFECISRADRINAHVADLLAGLGCFRIWIGSGSGSQRVLDAMQRGVTVEQIQMAVDLCKSRGIQTGMFLMWGYEGEDLSDIEATVRHVRQTQPDTFLTTVAYPIGGTPYFEDVADRVLAPASWAQSSDRDIRVAGRRSRRFYANADQLLKAEVELEKLSRSSLPAGPFQLAEIHRRIEMAREGMRTTFAETDA